MTEQEIRAKSLELAIRLIGVAGGKQSIGVTRNLMPEDTPQDTNELVEKAFDIGKKFEAFILKAPNQP